MFKEVIRHGIFIASTNDLVEERRAAAEAMEEWNEANWDAGLMFTPLRWELGAVADATVERPQDAITQQLFSKASGLLALFKHRLGTATGVAASGTCEEIRQALERADFPTALFFSSADVPADMLAERQRLEEWRANCAPGLSIVYKTTEELKGRVQSQLQEWSKKLPSSMGGTDLVAERGEPADYRNWLHACNPERTPCVVLLYNIELETFRTANEFAKYWSGLTSEPHVKKVVLLLPGYKRRRLEDYLKNWEGPDALGALHGRFFACDMRRSRTDDPKIATSTAFCLLRKGDDPASGSAIPGARIFGLSEPFSKPQGRTRSPEVIWQYKHSFITENEEVLQSLAEIWDDAYSAEEELTPLEQIRAEESRAPSREIQVDLTSAPSGGDDHLSVIRQLRERLFDPSVPSYLLDPKFFLLDWNPAFEMVFPTETFYRREHVKEFVCQLANVAELTRTGERFEYGEGTEWFDMEALHYRSPKYGDMRFSKIASRVDAPFMQGSIGWCVALHVNGVEDLESYTRDLRLINEADSLTSVYAQPYRDIVVEKFPPYRELLDRHVQALSGCENILDAGCGTGALTLELLSRGKSVTAVDSNDRMLDLARETLKSLPAHSRISPVKANVETLHRPNVDYPHFNIGIRIGYDGLAMMNSFHPLSSPSATLTRIREDLLKPGAVLAMSLPKADTDLDALLGAMQEHWGELGRNNEAEPWTTSEWDVLTQVNRLLVDRGLLTRHSQDYEQVLDEAGFAVESTEDCYAGQGIFVTARAR